jgi:hypothetical protein
MVDNYRYIATPEEMKEIKLLKDIMDLPLSDCYYYIKKWGTAEKAFDVLTSRT